MVEYNEFRQEDENNNFEQLKGELELVSAALRENKKDCPMNFPFTQTFLMFSEVYQKILSNNQVNSEDIAEIKNIVGHLKNADGFLKEAGENEPPAEVGLVISEYDSSSLAQSASFRQKERDGFVKLKNELKQLHQAILEKMAQIYNKKIPPVKQFALPEAKGLENLEDYDVLQLTSQFLKTAKNKLLSGVGDEEKEFKEKELGEAIKILSQPGIYHNKTIGEMAYDSQQNNSIKHYPSKIQPLFRSPWLKEFEKEPIRVADWLPLWLRTQKFFTEYSK